MATISLEHLSRNGQTTAKVGDPCTLLLYSDSHAATVAWVSPSGKTIKVQRDRATRIDRNGQSEDQQYLYERDSDATIDTYRFSEKNGWVNRTLAATRCLVGTRREWRDPTF
jgi:dipeptidyl aminopeptidase/acylaminoacyl peptidase